MNVEMVSLLLLILLVSLLLVLLVVLVSTVMFLAAAAAAAVSLAVKVMGTVSHDVLSRVNGFWAGTWLHMVMVVLLRRRRGRGRAAAAAVLKEQTGLLVLDQVILEVGLADGHQGGKDDKNCQERFHCNSRGKCVTFPVNGQHL